MHVGQDFPKQSVLVVFWQDFASLKSLMKNFPRSLLKALPTQHGAAEVLTPEPCRMWAQSGQKFPLEAVHPLWYYYLHILVSNPMALRGLSLVWPHSFQRPSHCGKGCDLCSYISYVKQPKTMAIDPCALAMPVWFLKEGFHKGALPQPWPSAGLAGVFSHSEHKEFSCLNSCSVMSSLFGC